MKLKNYLYVSLLFLAGGASAQWNTSPSVNTLIATAVFDQQEIRIVKDGKGGAIMAWEDFRANGTLADIYAQRVNSEGVVKWTTNGVPICTNIYDQRNVAITETSDGGAIICWRDARNGNLDYEVYAQRIDSNGTVKWTANGVAVCPKALNQGDAKIVSDGADGAFIVWTDSLNYVYDLYAQHLDGNGTLLWPSTGLAICTSFDKQINPRIEKDATGGCIITWMDKRYGDYDIYAQRVTSGGTIKWTANGVLVCSSSINQSNPKLDPDGSGGAIISWQDNRNGDYDIYAQRIDSTGAKSWTSTGVVICNALNSQSAVEVCTKGGISGAIIAWKDARSGTGTQIYMQRVNSSGAVQWASNGILVGTGINPNLAEDGSGGVIVTWQDSTNGDWNVLAHRVDATGNKLWGTTPVSVGIAADNQTSPKNVSDGNGGSIFSFQDKRTGDFDVYAHHLYADGTAVGIKETLKINSFISCYPNPSNGIITIENMNAKAVWKIDIYDAAGKCMTSENVSGKTTFTFNTEQLARGIYFYRATMNGETAAGKFIVE